MPHWKIKQFDELTPREIHDLYQLRSLVFVLEQKCIYLDQDGKDLSAYHQLCYSDDYSQLLAYDRIMFPNHDEGGPVRFGRVAVHPDFRGQGLARKLIASTMEFINTHSQGRGKVIEIAAQVYLVDFYKSFGLEVTGEIYDDDGISHIKMKHLPQPKPTLVPIEIAHLFFDPTYSAATRSAEATVTRKES